ncbi:hypothetical protein FRC08_013385, partial [Ceratobasidium sp. 394]
MPLTRAMAAAQVADNENDKDSEGSQPGPSKPIPRKRAKNNKDVARPPKKSGKLSLKRILDMPPEVFAEVASYLMPADLLSLARSNKFFRKIFMSRSSQYIWQTTFKNLPDLPPCPPELCEPQYASLIFSKTCSKCGGRALRRMDPYLHVRLCNSCRDAEIVEIGALSDFYPLLPRSILIKEPSYGCVYTLVREYNKVLEHANDKKTFPAWSKARLVEIVERQERGEELEDFLDFMEDERDLEIEDLKMRRQDEIETRLLEHGWTKRDMIPSPANLVQWKKLVWQPKPITDR